MSTIKTNKIQTLGGFTYNVPVQVVTSSLGAGDLGTTATSTSDRTTSTNNPAWAITTTTTTWTDTSNLQLTITPRFANSIIRLDLNVMINTTTANSAGAVRIKRGSTIVWRPIMDASGPYSIGYTSTTSQYLTHYISVFDSPATTSPVTYSLQYRTYAGGTCRIFGVPDANSWNSTNYLIATEIAQ